MENSLNLSDEIKEATGLRLYSICSDLLATKQNRKQKRRNFGGYFRKKQRSYK